VQRSPQPVQRSEEVPLTRLVPWLAFFVLLGVGVYLYFSFEHRITPLLG
jgi:hypothetical protein